MGYFVSLLLAMFSKNKMNIKIPKKLKIGSGGNSFQINNGDCLWRVENVGRLRLIQFSVLFKDFYTLILKPGTWCICKFVIKIAVQCTVLKSDWHLSKEN